MVKLAAAYSDKVHFLMVNVEGPSATAKAEAFGAKHGIVPSNKTVHHFLAAKVPDEYNIKYIPHKVLIKGGKIVKNYGGIKLSVDVPQML